MGYIVNMTNSEVRILLARRDGHFCQWEHCKSPHFDPEDLQGMTIDHKLPVSYCKEIGMTSEETNDLSNLQLLHRTCNSAKGSLLPNEDGSYDLPEFKSRQQKVPRVPVTDCCTSGRMIYPGDTCVVCGSGAQPHQFPATMKKSPKDCLHVDTDFCYMCLLQIVPRGDDGFDWRKLYA